MKWDGHTHTCYCPHGTKDTLDAYVEKAIAEGFEQYSITEHAPLPAHFNDPAPLQDSAMRMEDLNHYLDECQRIKKKYKAKIEVKIGLEIDYLAGMEEDTTHFLDQVGPKLDDAILSLHFLPVQSNWACIDYSPDDFEQNIVAHFATVDHVYAYYYDVLLQGISADLGKYKPNRIGHFTLIEKFKMKFPSENKKIWWDKAVTALQEVKKKGYQLDFNTAGLQKPLCRDVYPSAELLQVAKILNIPFVYGSDAHQAKHVGYDYPVFNESCR